MSAQKESAGFRPTLSEIRRVHDLAKWCEEASGTNRTVAGEPISQLLSRCVFGIADEVASRCKGESA